MVLSFLGSISYGQTCTGLGTSQFSDIVYVSPTGQPSSAGTDADPTDLLTGLGMLGGNTDKMYLQGGLYTLSNALVMPSDAQLIGGFNADWVKDNSAETVIYRDANNIQTAPNRLVGIQCVGQSNFRLQDLTVQVASGQGLGTSVYGIYLNNCADYQLVRCKVNAGNGGNGVNGSPGQIGIDGADGEPGEEGSEDGGGSRQGGVGGCCSYPGSFAGGEGGDGGERGTYEFPAGGEAFPGYSGTDGAGPGGGGTCLRMASCGAAACTGACSGATASKSVNSSAVHARERMKPTMNLIPSRRLTLSKAMGTMT